MRMTVRIPARTHARLRRLAERRGERGLSRVVVEAIEAYTAGHSRDRSHAERVRRGLAVLGTWDDETAEAVRRNVHESRKHSR